LSSAHVTEYLRQEKLRQEMSQSAEKHTMELELLQIQMGNCSGAIIIQNDKYGLIYHYYGLLKWLWTNAALTSNPTKQLFLAASAFSSADGLSLSFS
jgi:hypothetical protein